MQGLGLNPIAVLRELQDRGAVAARSGQGVCRPN